MKLRYKWSTWAKKKHSYVTPFNHSACEVVLGLRLLTLLLLLRFRNVKSTTRSSPFSLSSLVFLKSFFFLYLINDQSSSTSSSLLTRELPRSQSLLILHWPPLYDDDCIATFKTGLNIDIIAHILAHNWDRTVSLLTHLPHACSHTNSE